jgi:hypothetical protein
MEGGVGYELKLDSYQQATNDIMSAQACQGRKGEQEGKKVNDLQGHP